MRHVDQLVEVGRSAARVLREQENWVHRRVESLTFPIPDSPVYRRKVSIDFSIPVGLRSIDHEPHRDDDSERADQETPKDEGRHRRAHRYYVPLSIVQKWPPLHRLDLRGEDGKPVPFLTGHQNQLLDAAVLVQMADDAAADTPLSDQERLEVARIALARDEEASQAYVAVCPSLVEKPQGAVSSTIERLRLDRTFVSLAQQLCLNTILWLRTEGEVDDREIVKFAYDVPWDGNLGWFDLASFGLAPVIWEFDAPHVGSTGSYHLNLAIPSPLRAVDSQIVLYDASRDVGHRGGSLDQIDPQDTQYSASPGLPVRHAYDDFELYTDVKDRQAKFYVTGERHGLAGRVRVAVRLEVDRLLRSLSLGATLIAGVIGAFAVNPSLVERNSSAAVAVLLVVPALLAYLLRPSEHVLTGRILAGLRALAILSGTWPLIAAALVVVVSSSTALRWSLAGLAILEIITAAALLLPVLQAQWDTRSQQ